MDLSHLIKKGDHIRINMKEVELEGVCVETSVVEFQRKYRIHFNDGGEDLWMDNYMVRHLATVN